MADYIPYNFEYKAEEKIKVGYIGCGGHSYRNVYPTFQYAPIDLVACCDLDAARAEAYQRLFGAREAYTDHRAMLAREDLDAVFVVTNYDEKGHPRATELAIEAMQAGKHVWMEKPPGASVADIERMRAVSRETGKFVLVGMKKIFFPAVEKVKSLIDAPEFGGVSSISVRYPQSMPANTGDDRAMIGFLDHIAHPGAILVYLMGPIAQIFFQREAATGATVTALRFVSGAIGTMHLVAGQSGTSPLERLEVVGRGANVVLENGVDLTYYRPGHRGAYGRASSYLTDNDQAPLHWQPEFSLGVLDNKALFLLGYVQEVRYFCECVLTGTPPTRAGLDDALEIFKLYEAYRQPEGTVIQLQTSG
jgi:predicted dehydrogenase